MSITDLRDTFNAVSMPAGVRCTGARLMYCDNMGNTSGARNHSLVVFDTVRGADNTIQTLKTDPIPPGADLTGIVRALAQKAVSA